MACELCGADPPLALVHDIYGRLSFRICLTCRDAHTRIRPLTPDPRASDLPHVGGDDTRMPRLPPEIECPVCRGSGGDECGDCSGTGGDTEQRTCTMCEGDGAYPCYTCKGSGKRMLGTCATCDGSGRVSCEKCNGSGTETVRHLCPACEGSGHLCHRCGGHGVVRLYS